MKGTYLAQTAKMFCAYDTCTMLIVSVWYTELEAPFDHVCLDFGLACATSPVICASKASVRQVLDLGKKLARTQQERKYGSPRTNCREAFRN